MPLSKSASRIGVNKCHKDGKPAAGLELGEFGPDDQLGRLNYLTEENTVKAAQEIKTGKRFCLSLPLNVPATDATNTRRKPPILKPVVRDGHTAFNLRIDNFIPGSTQVVSDDAVLLYNQHSTQWDSFGHIGGLFDADGDGVDEIVQYNGHKLVNEAGEPRYGISAPGTSVSNTWRSIACRDAACC